MNHLFKWIVRLLGAAYVAGLVAGVLLTSKSASAPKAPDAVTPYFVEATYPAWLSYVYPPEAIPLDHIQQIGHVFVMPGESGALTVPDGFVMPQLIELVHAANKKVLIGVGGEDSHDEFASMVADTADRATFVQNLTDFVTANGYDGVVIDWEFPQTTADRENLNAFMAELRASLDAMGQDPQLNIAVSGGDWFGRWIDVDAITPVVDYYIVMTYGYHGTWSAQSGHNTPLYSPPPEVDNLGSVHESVQYWAETRGVPRSQIVVGLSFHSISFDSEDLYQPFTSCGHGDYGDVQPLIGNGYTRHWDSTCQVPYLTQDDGPTLWSYDDPQSIGLKCDYVIENDLAGVMIWDVTADLINGQQELLETVADKLMPQPSLFLSVAPGNVAIYAGQAATYTLSVNATSSVTAPVSLTLHDQPADVSATFDPNPVSPPSTSLLHITTTMSTVAGIYPMTVVGTAGPVTGTASLGLIVASAPPTSFTLSISPTIRVAKPNEVVSYTALVTGVGGFSQPVSLTVIGLPTGVDAAWSTNPVAPGGSSVLTLSVSGGSSSGEYVLQVVGIADLQVVVQDAELIIVEPPRTYLPIILK